ncbi:MAG TPA: sugar transferase [Dehalococcoidia bacterium]|nr:sugar transferase [Dehalococcoidia bacterium]
MKGGNSRAERRLFDLVAAVLGTAILTPLFVLIAIALRLDSPGPVLFRQVRIGRHGRPFLVYKFRTMYSSSAPRPHSAPQTTEAVDFESFVFTPDTADPRVTPIGRVLRKTSMDELPQLLNVIRGEMALVGPRPEIPELVALYPAAFHERHSVLPGITGLAQVSGRSDLTYAQTIRYDLAYVKMRSFRNDLAILGRTIGAVLRKSGAR